MRDDGSELDLFDIDAVATGVVRQKLHIAGRPSEGRKEKYVLLEEPEEPVQMHWNGKKLVPHLRSKCPCGDKWELKSLWYLGGAYLNGDLVIVELTTKCFRMAQAAAANLFEGKLTGLLIEIVRADCENSPRVLRCEQKVPKVIPWPYHTRLELARIWEIPIRPRIYIEEAK